MAAQLLTTWHADLPPTSYGVHLSSMVTYADEAPVAAWMGTSPFWGHMDAIQRASAIKFSWGGPAKTKMLEDLMTEQNHLDADAIALLLIEVDGAKLPQHEESLTLLASSLTHTSDGDEKNRIANGIFSHIVNLPDPLEAKSLFITACSVQNRVQPAGVPIIASAMRGDPQQRQRGLALLSDYLRVPGEAHIRDAFIPALAPVLAESRGDILRLLVGLLRAQGWLTDLAIVAALQQALDGLKRDRSKEARTDKGLLVSILPNNGKRKST